MWLPLHLMLSNDSDKSIQHVVSFWFVRKSYLDCNLVEPEEGCQRPQKCCCDNFVIKLTQPLSIIPTGTQGSFFAVSVTECFFYRTRLLALCQTPNLNGQRITFCWAPTLPSVRHGWPYQEYKTPASIALWVIGTCKPPYHNNIVIP